MTVGVMLKTRFGAPVSPEGAGTTVAVFRMFHRETDSARVARNRDAIFDLHSKALAWLEQHLTMRQSANERGLERLLRTNPPKN